MELYENYLSKTRQCRTVYIGGGTPGMLSSKQFKRLFAAIFSHFNLLSENEICVEIRPGTEIDEEKIIILKELGVTRISMGCQSLDDDILRLNGRNHSSDMFYKTYNIIKKVGFPVVNVDIMSGLLGEDEGTFLSTIDKILRLNPENITIYKLELYYNSKLYKKVYDQHIKVMSNEEEIKLVRLAYKKILEEGYFLGDNFSFVCKPEELHLHRSATWSGEDMIGLGLSSHSKRGMYIYQNYSELSKYFKELQEGHLPIQRAYHFSVKENMVREMIFAVKGMKYDLTNFEKKFGVDAMIVFGDELNELKKGGFIRIDKEEMITSFEGAIFADDIVKVFYPKEQKQIELGHYKRI